MPPTYHLPSPGRSSKQAWSLVRKGLRRHEVVGGLYANAHIDLVRTVGQLDLLPKLLDLGQANVTEVKKPSRLLGKEFWSIEHLFQLVGDRRLHRVINLVKPALVGKVFRRDAGFFGSYLQL